MEYASKTKDKKKAGKKRLPTRYQQFLDDEDGGTWEYQKVTKIGEEICVERRGKGYIKLFLIQIQSATWIPPAPKLTTAMF